MTERGASRREPRRGWAPRGAYPGETSAPAPHAPAAYRMHGQLRNLYPDLNNRNDSAAIPAPATETNAKLIHGDVSA